jgi:hypothetical protein
MKFKIKDPMRIMVRVEGKSKRVREISAILDFNCHLSWMLRLDAMHLGYGDVQNNPHDLKTIAASITPEILTIRGLEFGIMVNLTKVSIGDLSASNVKAFILPTDIPRLVPIDMVLGRSFLNNFKTVINPKEGYITITPLS